MMMMSMLPTVARVHMVTISATDSDTPVEDAVTALGFPNVGDGSILIADVPSGVSIGATNTSTPAMTINLTGRDTCYLENNGTIIGDGGAGGSAGNQTGGAGGSGGPAVDTDGTTFINNIGTIGGGSGGNGGSGGSGTDSGKGCSSSSGSAGSAGADGGGAAGSTGSSGSGCAAGGGGAGGAAGNYIVGNANVTWEADGTRRGGVA
jgi:hypothetical protein|tara:strand:+ start:1420 stop:2037 length:618 start_codon:yes stop_codon:yes gene_type:complete